MKLERTDDGWVCGSDRSIRMIRARKATLRDGSRGDGWDVRIDRAPLFEFGRIVRTLDEATEWARQHGRPRFLDNLIAGLASAPHVEGLYAASGAIPPRSLRCSTPQRKPARRSTGPG